MLSGADPNNSISRCEYPCRITFFRHSRSSNGQSSRVVCSPAKALVMDQFSSVLLPATDGTLAEDRLGNIGSNGTREEEEEDEEEREEEKEEEDKDEPVTVDKLACEGMRRISNKVR